MALAVMGHGVVLEAWPVSLLMVFHARRLERVKTIDSTVSVHLSPFGVEPGHEVCGSSGPLSVALRIVVDP